MANINDKVKCKSCNGTGRIRDCMKVLDDLSIRYIKGKECSKCHGTGELDWIENICGKQEVFKINVNTMKINSKQRVLKSEWTVEFQEPVCEMDPEIINTLAGQIKKEIEDE